MPTSHIPILPRWRLLEHEFGTQFSARSNSNVRSMGQNLWSNSPERGQQKCSNAAPLPVPPPIPSPSKHLAIAAILFCRCRSLSLSFRFCSSHRSSRHHAALLELLKLCQKLQYREKRSSKQIKNKNSTLSLVLPMLDLNNCVATSVDHSYHDMQNWIETGKKCRKKTFSKPFST